MFLECKFRIMTGSVEPLKHCAPSPPLLLPNPHLPNRGGSANPNVNVFFLQEATQSGNFGKSFGETKGLEVDMFLVEIMSCNVPGLFKFPLILCSESLMSCLQSFSGKRKTMPFLEKIGAVTYRHEQSGIHGRV